MNESMNQSNKLVSYLCATMLYMSGFDLIVGQHINIVMYLLISKQALFPDFSEWKVLIVSGEQGRVLCSV